MGLLEGVEVRRPFINSSWVSARCRSRSVGSAAFDLPPEFLGLPGHLGSERGLAPEVGAGVPRPASRVRAGSGPSRRWASGSGWASDWAQTTRAATRPTTPPPRRTPESRGCACTKARPPGAAAFWAPLLGAMAASTSWTSSSSLRTRAVDTWSRRRSAGSRPCWDRRPSRSSRRLSRSARCSSRAAARAAVSRGSKASPTPRPARMAARIAIDAVRVRSPSPAPPAAGRRPGLPPRFGGAAAAGGRPAWRRPGRSRRAPSRRSG